MTGLQRGNIHEADRSLDLAGGERLLAVVSSKTHSLGGHAIKRVVNERVHDGLNGLVGTTGKHISAKGR